MSEEVNLDALAAADDGRYGRTLRGHLVSEHGASPELVKFIANAREVHELLHRPSMKVAHHHPEPVEP